MRILCVLILLAIVGFGIPQVLEQQRQVTSFSATTTAVVLEVQMEGHRTGRGYDASRGSYVSEPVVKFQYEAQGRQFTSKGVFPDAFRQSIGGNIGTQFARTLLERFDVGEETTAYYNPDIPAEACLIRRPSLIPYLLMILLPMVVVSGIAAYAWRSSGPRAIGGRIATLWHIVGLASASHYFYLAGADYAGVALLWFGVYTQLGLVPVAFALPDSESSETAKRVRTAIVCSLLGTFAGIWLGAAVGLVATKMFSAGATVSLNCWGYGIAIPPVLLFLLGLFMTDDDEEDGIKEKGKSKREKAPRQPRPRRSDQHRVDEFVPMPPPDGTIPYQVDQRSMPSGEDLETLLPAQVGPFRRAQMDDPDEVRDTQIYAEYRSDGAEMFSDAGKITVELGVCGDPASA